MGEGRGGGRAHSKSLGGVESCRELLEEEAEPGGAVVSSLAGKKSRSSDCRAAATTKPIVIVQ